MDSKAKVPTYRPMKGPAVGALTGAEIIAIQSAERYGTDLVIMENGKVVHISPEEMRRRLGLEK